METGDTIKISKEGNVIDGQHRLSAIVRSGKTVSCAIARNVDSEVFEVLDTGKIRSGGDVLYMAGYKNTLSVSAAARTILLHKSGLNTRPARGSSATTGDITSNKKILEFVNENEEALMEAVNFGSNANKKCSFLARSEYAVYFFIFSEKSPDDARLFLEKFVSGSNLEENSPILLLRRAMEKSATSHIKLTAYAKKYLIVRAWNAFRQKRKVGVLQYNKDFQMPEII